MLWGRSAACKHELGAHRIANQARIAAPTGNYRKPGGASWHLLGAHSDVKWGILQRKQQAVTVRNSALWRDTNLYSLLRRIHLEVHLRHDIHPTHLTVIRPRDHELSLFQVRGPQMRIQAIPLIALCPQELWKRAEVLDMPLAVYPVGDTEVEV